MQNIKQTILTAALLLASSFSFAISVDSNTGLLANGQVWTGNNVQIVSSIGAGNNVSLGRGTTVQGSTYSNNTTYLGRAVSVSGSVSGNGIVSMDTSSSVGGNVYGGNTWLGSKSSVGGNVTSVSSSAPNANGNVSTGSKVTVGGNMNAGGDIWVGSNSSIAGDASPGIGKNISTGSNVSIGGSTTPSNPTADTVTVPDIPTPGGSITPGTQSIWVSSGNSYTLDPGSYASVSTGNEVNLALSAGNYTLASFWMSNEGTMTFDTTGGDIIIDVLNNFGAGNDFEFVILGPGEVFINSYEGNFSFGNNADIDATLIAYEGDFYADDDAYIVGSIAAQNISLDNGSYFEYRGSSPTPSVPEPLTAVALFVSVGGLGIYMKKRIADGEPTTDAV